MCGTGYPLLLPYSSGLWDFLRRATAAIPMIKNRTPAPINPLLLMNPTIISAIPIGTSAACGAVFLRLDFIHIVLFTSGDLCLSVDVRSMAVSFMAACSQAHLRS